MNTSKVIIIISACVVAVALSLTVRGIEQRQLQMLEELNRIAQQLDSLPGANRATLGVLTGEFLGAENAPLTMVEFIDLQCPFSRRFHTEAFDRIRQQYVDTGKVRYFTRQFPLQSINPFAIDAARAALCAGEQRQLWRMRHTILVNSAALNPTRFAEFARELQLNPDEFGACLATPARVDKRLQADRAEGARIGISGTPTFLIGLTKAGTFEGLRLSGARPFEVFAATFDQLLTEAESP
jgi:protein-disulfide isomerase